jgi:fumarylacetoacetase
MLDHTHDPTLACWIDSANDPTGDFPIQNLPYGVFTADGRPRGPRIGVAIGDWILDLAEVGRVELLPDLSPEIATALGGSSLNGFMALGPDHWRAARHAISGLLDGDNPVLRDRRDLQDRVLVDRATATMHLPATVGDYTDFYASIHHATNVGSMFRPDNPLMPNYRHLPVGYHGRASSLVASGTPVRRPHGQTCADGADGPAYGPSRLLDYELEMGFFVGPENQMGEPIGIERAHEHIFGMVIVNDWSARDVQKWEYQPLGPFNAKNFATTVSPWVVTLDALAPYRLAGPPRGADDPPLLDYLRPASDEARQWGLDITVQVHLASEAMRSAGQDPLTVSRGSFADMYWTITQMLAHHSSTGCNMRPGDLLASGTVSGPAEDARGCLLERTWRGQNPIDLPDGTQRRFLQDGDEVVISAHAESADGRAARIGFGDCRGVILPA